MKTRLLLELSSLFLCLTLLTGCDKVKVDWVDDDAKSGDFASQVAEDLEDASKSECEYLYNYFEGNAIYVEKVGEKIGTTAEWQSLCAKVHSQFGWDMEKYDGLTETVKDELVDAGFEDPKSLSDIDTRKKLSSILHEAAQGALKAKNSK